MLNAHVKFINKSTVGEREVYVLCCATIHRKKGVWLEIFSSLKSQQHEFYNCFLSVSLWEMNLSSFSVSNTHSHVTHTNVHATWSAPTLKQHNPSLSDKNTRSFSSAFLNAAFDVAFDKDRASSSFPRNFKAIKTINRRYFLGKFPVKINFQSLSPSRSSGPKNIIQKNSSNEKLFQYLIRTWALKTNEEESFLPLHLFGCFSKKIFNSTVSFLHSEKSFYLKSNQRVCIIVCVSLRIILDSACVSDFVHRIGSVCVLFF